MDIQDTLAEIERLTSKSVVHKSSHSILPYKLVFITENHGLEIEELLSTEYIQIAEVMINSENFDFEYYQNYFKKNDLYRLKYELINRISRGEIKVIILKPINKF